MACLDLNDDEVENEFEEGVTRKIRVNREYITDGKGKPFVIDGKPYDSVEILGPSKLVISVDEPNGVGCGTVRVAYIETDSALEVS